MYTLSLRTAKRSEMIDITGKINDIISKSKIQSGMCIVFVPHTTAGITINENADPDVTDDIMMKLDKIVPFKDNYTHFEGNSDAHIKASMFGFSLQLIIENNRLVLGTWQGIYFCEFDGPRTRQVYVKIM